MDLNRLRPTQRAEQLVLARVVVGGLGREEAGVHHLLHQAVVAGQRHGHAVAQPVQPAVPHMRPDHLAAHPVEAQRDHGGVHAVAALQAGLFGVEAGVRLLDGVTEPDSGQALARRRSPPHRLVDRGDHAPRRLVPTAVPPGPVRQHGPGQVTGLADTQVVLVVVAGAGIDTGVDIQREKRWRRHREGPSAGRAAWRVASSRSSCSS